jgi:hypothetical protein
MERQISREDVRDASDDAFEQLQGVTAQREAEEFQLMRERLLA